MVTDVAATFAVGVAPTGTVPPVPVHGLGSQTGGALGYFHDRMIMKFTQDGKLLMQIGKPGASKGSNDVENLRLHYGKTLEHWRRRFDNATEQVTAMFDEPFVRAWRLYLAGSQAAFTTGCMQLFQVLFARGGSNELPWTRVSG